MYTGALYTPVFSLIANVGFPSCDVCGRRPARLVRLYVVPEARLMLPF